MSAFRGKSGHHPDLSQCPLMTQSGHRTIFWWTSEPCGEPEYRPVQRHVELVMREPAALRVINRQRLVSGHGAPDDGFRSVNFVVQGCEHLPGELAADIEAADVAAQDKILGRSKLVAQPQADQGIDPAHALFSREDAGPRESQVKNVRRAGCDDLHISALPPGAATGI